jgi:hypothetical protein
LPSKDIHVQKANDNESFAGSLSDTPQASLNWKLVILFYAAVHLVEAYLAKNLAIHLRSHTTRDGYISREANLRQIRNQYWHLKFYGYNARYEPDQFTKQDVTKAMTYLSQVKGTLTPLL